MRRGVQITIWKLQLNHEVYIFHVWEHFQAGEERGEQLYGLDKVCFPASLNDRSVICLVG